MGDSDLLKERTIRDFGDQWSRYRENEGYYASTDLLQDIVEPLLPVGEIREKRVADIGSGTGRIVNMLLSAGAAHVVAVEPSAAFEVLGGNVPDPGAVTLLRIPGDELPAYGDLDLVLSIGVLHHIPDPAPVVNAAFNALKPGGRMLVWLYGKEGNETYLAFSEPLRAITRRLPHPVLVAVVWTLYPFLAVYIRLARHARIPLHDYLNSYLGKLSPKQRRLVMYDQLNPSYAKYYTRDEARALLAKGGFVDVRLYHRHNYSWTVLGCKP